MSKKFIAWFEEVDKNDVGLVGGKGANLGEMIQADLPIPYGFIITSKAYFYFIKSGKLDSKINKILSHVNFESPNELQQASKNIKELIINTSIPKEIVHQIIEFYENLTLKEQKYLTKKNSHLRHAVHKIKNLYKSPLVAVRSSATAEDLPTASFAGQQETFLNIRGESVLVNKVRECYASLFTERAIFYRHEQKFDHMKLGLAAIVQRMVQSEKSGVAFSIDPVNNDKTKITIEAIFGLGEYIVQGKVTPDHYEVDKKSFVILKKDINYQTSKLVKSGVVNKEIKLGKKIGSVQKIGDMEIEKLAIIVKDIENHYFFPQDIEWAIEKDNLFIVQSRPITTIKNSESIIQNGKNQLTISNPRLPILTGSPASPGIGIGPVKIIRTPSLISLVKKGDVLVAPLTNPDYVPAMRKASAIVTEKGGRTSHAAIVSREMGIPAVVGAEGATKILKNNIVISVNGSTGEIFKGSVLSKAKVQFKSSLQLPVSRHHTLTKIYVNLAEPELAQKVSHEDCDGIGLLRAEFMIAEIGTHPKEFIKQKKQNIFINKLTEKLLKFVRFFTPRPVVYRATDFKTNEYRHLKGGDRFEPHEENPMIGFRGASRYIANPDVFNLELQALGNIWKKGYRNLHLMIPFVRAPWEVIKIKELIKKSGLFDYPDFKLWIMVEVPSCALNLEEFIKVGIDGVSIGTNDLTMMLMGVDRDNESVTYIYDERTPVVEKTLEYIVKTCANNNITCSICGQAASDYPDLVEKLVEAGITSVSVNPDAIKRTRQLIFEIEKKIFKKHLK